jgi:hypothetical protein
MITVQKHTKIFSTVSITFHDNVVRVRTVLYWTRSSRTQFGVSINVWRLAGDTLNITCNFLYCNHQVYRDILITSYIHTLPTEIVVNFCSAVGCLYSRRSHDFVSHLYRVIKKSLYTWWLRYKTSNPHTIYDLKMAVTEHIRNVNRGILNAIFENRVRRVNKCLETGGGHFGHYL